MPTKNPRLNVVIDTELYQIIEKIAEKNFIQVNQESNTDPALEHLDASDFSALYSALLGMLQQ